VRGEGQGRKCQDKRTDPQIRRQLSASRVLSALSNRYLGPTLNQTEVNRINYVPQNLLKAFQVFNN
jgi:hypothetical protein